MTIRINSLCAVDNTYLKTPEGRMHLAIVMDLYPPGLVGLANTKAHDHRLVQSDSQQCPDPQTTRGQDRVS
ncbi:MAG: hypothetical protein ACI9C4_002000 [Paraglaciecola sp.]|jgi:hypothetical protein